jgi:hypothetical protein
MKRFTLVVLTCLISASIYISSFFGVVSSLVKRTSYARYASGATEAVQVAPFLALVVFGCYALFTIGYKLFNFNDCEQASLELTEVRL